MPKNEGKVIRQLADGLFYLYNDQKVLKIRILR